MFSCDAAKAVEMAHDALGVYLCSLEDVKGLIPEPSPPERIETHPGQSIALVDVDTLEYRQKYGSPSVKKTLSIPARPNDMAAKQHLNPPRLKSRVCAAIQSATFTFHGCVRI